MDKLDRLYSLQKALNDKTFAKNGLTNPDTGETLRIDDFFSACEAGRFHKDGAVAQWIQNYALALDQETAELVDSVPWKWWSKDKEVDIQNLRVEIVDALHFWLSLAMVAGMTPDDILRLYEQKNRVNHERQDSEAYYHMDKDEHDNEEIV